MKKCDGDQERSRYKSRWRLEHTGRRRTASPAVSFLQTDLNSLAFCALWLAPPFLQMCNICWILVSSRILLFWSYCWWETCSLLSVRKYVTYSAVTIMPTGKLRAFAASDGIFGPGVVRILQCFLSFEVDIGMYFCHFFLLRALSCGLTSFPAPWAEPSPMTRVWAGLLPCAINTFLPSGWYWGWSNSLIGTSSNSYGVLSGEMHTVLLHPSCCTGLACLT